MSAWGHAFEDLLEEQRVLYASLQKYGEHNNKCWLTVGGERCNCGLSDVLAKFADLAQGQNSPDSSEAGYLSE